MEGGNTGKSCSLFALMVVVPRFPFGSPSISITIHVVKDGHKGTIGPHEEVYLMSNISHISHISTQNERDYTVKWAGLKCRDARFVRPRKGELKANRTIVGTDARTVRPYMRMNNQLVSLFTLSTGQLKTGNGAFLLFSGPTMWCALPHRGCTFDSPGLPTTVGYPG